MLFQIPKSTAHKRAEKIFGTGSLLNPLNWPKAAFSYFFGSSISKVVLPAQVLSTDQSFLHDTLTQEAWFISKVNKNSMLQIDFHTLDCFDGASLETMELTHNEQIDKPKAEQEYVIYLCGNGMCMQDLYNEIYDMCTTTQRNFVAFNLKNVIKSHGKVRNELDLINDVISQIERLIADGVDPSNICLVGHSLGAAFATLTAYTYYKEGTPIRIFNGRSFANFASLSYLQEKNSGSSDFNAWMKKMSLQLANFEIEVAKFYDEIPDEYKDYITINEDSLEGDERNIPDGVIPLEISLRYKIQDQDVTHLVRSRNTLFGIGHNDPLRTLEAEDGLTAEDRCRSFILNKP
ncbi:lipase family protein [Legionella rowbothamii]|uniref:lipase family protein n=1 Tax=Legionella rowbothamii TaxID=96229 RepID=UPI0013EFBE9C|nr:hypothetical protein [Legionella rowbothamii]